jgi:signal transduction histidine kinase
LINDELDLAETEAGCVELVVEKFNVFALIQKVSIVIKYQMSNNNNRFDIVCDANIGKIIGDEY